MSDERCAQCDKPANPGYLKEKPFGHFKIGGQWVGFCSTQCKHQYQMKGIQSNER